MATRQCRCRCGHSVANHSRRGNFCSWGPRYEYSECDYCDCPNYHWVDEMSLYFEADEA